MPLPFRFLTEHDVRRLLPASETSALVDLMASALADFSSGRAVQPVRSAIPVGPPGQYLGVMPGMLAGSDALGAKLVSVALGNPARGLPSHTGVIVLFDPDTGLLRAIMDAGYITEVRTAAVSAVSVRYMARPCADRLAVIGAGAQARGHVGVLSRSRRVAAVRVWGPDLGQVERFAGEVASETGVSVRPAATAEEAVADADLIVLATSSDTPVLRSEWVRDGTHVVSVGACRPNQREIDPRLLARARLIVDSRAAALIESGDVLLGMADGCFDADHIAGELGEVVSGVVAGRTNDREVTVFKSLGLAVEDVAAAALVGRRAVEQRVGTELAL